LLDLLFSHVLFRVKYLLLDDFRLSFERRRHFEVPSTLSQLVLDEGVVVASIGATSVDDNTLEFVDAVFWEFQSLRV